MSNQKSLKEEIKENRGKFRDLSLSGKIQFIADYYWLHILAVLVLILLGVSIVRTVRDNNYNTALNVIIANNTVVGWVEENDSLETAILDGIVPYLNVDNVNDRVFVNDYYLVADSRDSELSAINSQTLTAMFAGAQIDVFIADRKAVSYFSSDIDPFFYDLSTILDENTLKQLDGLLVEYTFKDGSSIPYAIDVTDTPFAQNAGFVSDEVLITIPNNTERLDAAISFIQYVLLVNGQ
jgi:hypothetical protein